VASLARTSKFGIALDCLKSCKGDLPLAVHGPEKKSAMPSPVATRTSLPLASALRKDFLVRTIWANSCRNSISYSTSSFE